jgi:ATP-dependent DNA helicase DinG
MISLVETQTAGTPPGLVSQIEEIFSPAGLLSLSPNFEYRPQQQDMAVAVARALEAGENLIVEAGTGVGKSLAYLIPRCRGTRRRSFRRTPLICRSN